MERAPTPLPDTPLPDAMAGALVTYGACQTGCALSKQPAPLRTT